MSDNPYIVAGDALEGTSCGDYEVSSAIVDALYWAGCIQTDHRIIRTVEELEALDPDTLLMIDGAEAMTWEPRDLIRFKLQGGSPFPAVVVTPAAQVRAARKALEEA